MFFCGLVSKSISSFKSDVFIKFSGDEPLADSCFSVNGSDIDRDIYWLSKKFDSLIDGKAGYPIILFNRTCDWIAFESAHEELGVIAMNASVFQEAFLEYLKSNFVSLEELAEMASGSSTESIIAKALVSSYRSYDVAKVTLTAKDFPEISNP